MARRRKAVFTHKGWIGLAPIYIGALNGPDDTPLDVMARSAWLEWWASLNCSVIYFIGWLFGTDRAPFVVTDDVDPPIVRYVEEDE
jgi:hypothetical protein